MRLRSPLGGTFQLVSNGSGHSVLDSMSVLEIINELMHQSVRLATFEQPSLYYHSGTCLLRLTEHSNMTNETSRK